MRPHRTRRLAAVRMVWHAVAAAAALDSFAKLAAAATVTVSWIDGAAGNYTQPVAWSGGVTPNDGVNQFYNVIINRAGGAAVDGNLSAEILNLTIGASNSLTFDPGVQFSIIGQPGGGLTSISNDGTIGLNSSTLSATTRVQFKGGQVNLTGAGTILLGGTNTQITSISSGTQFSTSNFIRGTGNISGMAITNTGTIVADTSAGSLIVSPTAATILNNNGLLGASGFGILVLSGASVINGTGTISADGSGAVVQFPSSALSGGTLNTTGSGIIGLPPNSSGTLANLTSNARVLYDDGATLTLSGTIVNNGSISLSPSAVGASTINIGASTVTLNGTGTLQLGSTGAATTELIGNGPLVNSSNIVGHGSIAFTVVRNSGLIASNAGSGSLSISGSLNSPAVVNSGTIRAASGQMNLGFGTWDNTGGALDVVSGNTMTFGTGSSIVSLAITGGSLNVANGGTVDTVSGSGNTTLTSMAISNSGIINVNPGTSLTMVNDTYNGNNFVQLNGSSTANATLTINGGTTSFSGLAGIGLNTGFTSTIAINGNGTFDNHTFVSGGGLIGQNTLTIFNSGTITVGGNVFITLDPGPGGLTNTGTLQATIGTLLFAGGSYTNNGGTITAQLGGTVVLSDGAVITGGKYATGTNGGQVQTNVLSAVQVSNGTITNVGMTVVGTSSLTIGGTITNNGSLNVGASTGTARLLVGNASVTLNGTGTTTLSTGTGTAVIDGNGGTLNIGSQQLIHGDGTIGTGALGINNAGTISADDLILTINIGSLGMTNTGVLQNVTGGHLIINNVGGAGGGVINNAGGLIDAFGNSLSVDLNNGVVVKGGTINHATGSRKGVNVLSTSATLANLMNNGVVSLTNGTLTLVGTINDSDLGTIVDGADLEPATLTVGSGSVSLVGHGELAVGLNAVVTGSPGGMLTNGPQHVIDGSGTLGNNAIGLINQGTVIPFNGSTFTVNPGIGNLVNSGTIQSSTSLAPETGTLALSFNVGTCTNSGTILAASGGLITLSAGTLDSSSGTIIVTGAGAGTVTAVGTLVNNSGLLIAPGIKLDGQFTNLFTTLGPAVTGTSLVGAGSFTNGDATHPFASTRVFPLRVGTFTANSGTTSFAAGGGTLGTGSISSLTMAPGARLDVANHDLIIDYASTSPIATVASLVASGYAGGAWNGPGIDSIIAAAIDGDPLVTHKVGLGYADASMIGSPATFSGQSIDSTASLIRYTYVGDANIDGHVNALDFNAVASNFGGAAKIWPQGDFNYDGQVNTADFTALATNFNVVPLSGPALGVLVPEAALTTFPLLLLLSRRRRKQ